MLLSGMSTSEDFWPRQEGTITAQPTGARPGLVTVLLCAAPAILLAVAVLLPFRDKAFTIDDTVFMSEAEHALTDPWHPTAFEIAWSEVLRPVRLSTVMASGPVIAWLLVPSALAGGAEWLAHLVPLLLMVLAILATVSLGFRLGLGRRWAAASGLLLASTPAALGMAGTAMPDVPAMAFGIVGLERIVAWKRNRRLDQAVFASVFLALAALTRSHAILLLGIGSLFLLDGFPERSRWRRTPLVLWLPIVATPLLTLAIMLLTRDPAPGSSSPAGAIGFFSSFGRLPCNLLAFPIHWVLALPLALPWLALRPAAIARRWRLMIRSGVVALVLIGLSGWIGGFWIFTVPFLAALGTAVLWDILADCWTRRDAVQLALCLWILIPLSIVPYSHLPSKYLLVSAPAAVLLVARAMSFGRAVVAYSALGLAAVLGTTLGIAILRTDTAFAGLARRAAAELIAPQVAAGKQVWFAGHWGFQWYAQKAGARAVTLAPPRPTAGDLLVSSLRAKGQAIDRYPYRTRLASLAEDTPGGRIMCDELGAGFFANGSGYLPWVWGTVPLDELVLWRIDRLEPSLPAPSN
jgi:4-amino-4-deoxy-L-arabinose transferase-like glycosyltransferase